MQDDLEPNSEGIGVMGGEMEHAMERRTATNPGELPHLFLERANAGDVDGLVALYEADAVLATADGEVAAGRTAIRAFYADLLGGGPQFEPGEQRPTLTRDDLALTSTRLADGTVTVEVARRQPDGSWLWALDQPAIGRERNGH